MPTLLAINNYYYPRGGAETVFLEHTRLMESQGWRVIPFSMHHARNLATPWSRYFVDEIEFGSSYSLGDKLIRASRVVYSVQARRRLGQLLAVARPDLCHAHNIYHHISPSVLSLLGSHTVPIVLTLHDLKIACPAYNMLSSGQICERCRGGRLHNVVRHRCIKGSAALSSVVYAEAVLHRALGSYRHYVSVFIVPSRFYEAKLQEWGWPSSKLRYVPNFVDAQSFEPDPKPGHRLLYFGRLSREKGLHTLFEAVARTKTPLTVAGTGPDAERLQQLAVNVGADVQFLGFVTGRRLHDVIRASRAVVLPSEWYENAPMSILEAYALGKPVIGAKIGGIPELVRENETGFLFESGDRLSLAEAIRRTLVMPAASLEQMGRTARNWVESEFSPNQYLARVLAIYDELGVGRNARAG